MRRGLKRGADEAFGTVPKAMVRRRLFNKRAGRASRTRGFSRASRGRKVNYVALLRGGKRRGVRPGLRFRPHRPRSGMGGFGGRRAPSRAAKAPVFSPNARLRPGVPRTLRQLLPRGFRTKLPITATHNNAITIAGAATTYGAPSWLGITNNAANSTNNILAFSSFDLNTQAGNLQPLGRATAYSNWTNAVCLGMKYQVTLGNVVGDVIVGAVAAKTKADILAFTRDDLLPPYNDAQPYRHHTTCNAWTTDAGPSRVLTGYCSYYRATRLKNDDRIGDAGLDFQAGETYHETAIADPTVPLSAAGNLELPHMGIYMTNAHAGTHTIIATVTVTIWLDMFFFNRANFV